jgi:hypothetical protein
MHRYRIIALLSAQGTACLETALSGDDDTPERRASVELACCTDDTDAPIPGTWTDVSDNEAFLILAALALEA